MTRKPDKVSARLGKDNLELAEAASKDDFLSRENVYFYDAAPNLNKFATKGSDFEKKVIAKNPQLLVKLAATDVTANPVVLSVEGFQFQPAENTASHPVLCPLPGMPELRKKTRLPTR